MNRDVGGAEIAITFASIALLFALLALGMPEGALLGASVGVWVAGPLSTLVHELGHATAAVAVTPARALIRIGGDERDPLVLSLGRIDLRWSGGPLAVCQLPIDPARLPRARWIAIVLAGPAAEGLLCAVAVAGLMAAWDGPPFVVGLWASVAIASGLGVLNLVPFRHGGSLFSDGAQLLAAFVVEPPTRHECGPWCPCAVLAAAAPATWQAIDHASLLAGMEGVGEISVTHLRDALDGTGKTGAMPARAPAAFSREALEALRRAYYELSLHGEGEITPERLRAVLRDVAA